jgi:serine/threonine protein kinase
LDGAETAHTVLDEVVKKDPLLGCEFEGRYKLKARLGAGGMGSVYLAEQLKVGRWVALKILHANFAEKKTELRRFEQEARAIASLQHPNSIRLFDFGQTEEGIPYLVMEFLAGDDLATLLKDTGPLETGRVVSLAIQAFGALSEAHAKGIVHRDLKPANLFVTHITGEGETLKVLDFGIAKVKGPLAADMTLTQKGTTIGSPRYMAPEQARALEITSATDIYGMGCILYEMLTGRSVFIRETASDYIIAHVKEEPPWPCVGGKRLEGPLVTFILQCLEKRPCDRPANAALALEFLRGLQEGVAAIHSESLSEIQSTAVRPSSLLGVFPRVAATKRRPSRLQGPLSTSQIGMTEDPTAPISPRGNRLWWSLTGASFVVFGIGIAFLISSNVTGAESPVALVSDSSKVALKAVGSGIERSQVIETSLGNLSTEDASLSSTKRGRLVQEIKSANEHVHVRVLSQPPGAKIWRAGSFLGLTPKLLKTTKQSTRVHLRLRLDGHRPAQLSFLPTDHLSVTVPLSSMNEPLRPIEDLQ